MILTIIFYHLLDIIGKVTEFLRAQFSPLKMEIIMIPTQRSLRGLSDINKIIQMLLNSWWSYIPNKPMIN
jgi:hypothetical protein